MILSATSPENSPPRRGLPTLAFLAIALVVLPHATFAVAAESIITKAPMAFLYEPATETILYAKDADKAFAPGSLTKVMTAATVFHLIGEGELTPDRLCKVSEHAWRTGGAPSRRSTMFAAIKSEIAVEDLLKGLLVHNANDAAIALAECVDGSETAFARRMTEFAHNARHDGKPFCQPHRL